MLAVINVSSCQLVLGYIRFRLPALMAGNNYMYDLGPRLSYNSLLFYKYKTKIVAPGPQHPVWPVQPWPDWF